MCVWMDGRDGYVGEACMQMLSACMYPLCNGLVG